MHADEDAKLCLNGRRLRLRSARLPCCLKNRHIISEAALNARRLDFLSTASNGALSTLIALVAPGPGMNFTARALPHRRYTPSFPPPPQSHPPSRATIPMWTSSWHSLGNSLDLVRTLHRGKDVPSSLQFMCQFVNC